MKADESIEPYFYITGWIIIAIVGIGAGVCALLRIHITEIMPPCSIHYATGYYCPGCGGTRAVYALLHGQLLKSAFYHPFVLYTVIVGGWFMISQTIQKLTGGKLRIGLHYRNIYLWVGLAILVLNCLIKNAFWLFGGISLME